MSPAADARARLAARQAKLLQALTSPSAEIAGFDDTMLLVTARSLVNKRVRSAARVWPRLSAALGKDFDELFAEYATTHPLPGDALPLSDGWAFVSWLQGRRELMDEARLEVLAVGLRWYWTMTGLVGRRWPLLKWLRLRQTKKLVLVLRLPRWGEWWWHW